MTVLERRHLACRSASTVRGPDTVRRPVVRGGPRPDSRRRPPVAPLRFRGGGIVMSTVPHTRRPVSTPLTIALAGLSALVTLWLGSLAQFSADRVTTPASATPALGVVELRAGETLQQLAGRVAPDTPVGQVVDRIRDLNNLDSASLDAGRTLIAPIG